MNGYKFALNEKVIAKKDSDTEFGIVQKGKMYLVYHVVTEGKKDLIGLSLHGAHILFDSSDFSKVIPCECGDGEVADPKDNHIPMKEFLKEIFAGLVMIS